MDEFNGNDELLEGKITIGCGEFNTVEIMAKICGIYKKKYPRVQIAIHTGTADKIYDMMNKGLVDIGLFMEPVDTEGLDYIRISNSDHWVVAMRPDDPQGGSACASIGSSGALRGAKRTCQLVRQRF